MDCLDRVRKEKYLKVKFFEHFDQETSQFYRGYYSGCRRYWRGRRSAEAVKLEQKQVDNV
jgi:hypothetical protein